MCSRPLRCTLAKEAACVLHDGMQCCADVEKAGRHLHGAMQRWKEELTARSCPLRPSAEQRSAEDDVSAGLGFSAPVQQVPAPTDSLAHRLIGVPGIEAGEESRAALQAPCSNPVMLLQLSALL